MREKIYIVEDMAVARAALINTLLANNFLVVGSAASAEKAWADINQLSVDLVLLDINLTGEKDGIWLAEQIRSEKELPIVFLTAYGDSNTLSQLINLKPNGYLMKPYNEPTLLATIAIALRTFSVNEEPTTSHNPHIYIKNKGLKIKIDLNKVLYIKSDGNYIDIHLNKIKYTVRNKLKAFINALPIKTITQVHQRYAINLSYIEAISNNTVVVNSINIPVSKSYKEDFMSKLKQL